MSGQLRRSLVRSAAIWLMVLLVGCGAAGPSTARSVPDAQSDGLPVRPGRTLVLATRSEPSTLSSVPLFSPGGGSVTKDRLFNAGLTLADGADVSHPYLAESLPQLNSHDWTVFSDGTMETVYRLRVGVVWHDGTPLTAHDFVFGWRVVSNPIYGLAGLPPQKLMADVSAADDRTIRVLWSQPFSSGGSLDGYLRGRVFLPLPRHLLEASQSQGLEALRIDPYWTVQYVGVGPFRLDRWEAGSFLEGRAADTHVLGRPKIDRLRVVFAPDPNALLAHMLAGEVDVPIDDPIRIAEGLVLKERWASGVVSFIPATLRWITIQHRAEYASPPAILDLRVRRALAHGLDKPALNQVLFGGQGIPSNTLDKPSKPYFASIERGSVGYPFDRTRTEQLMLEAGFPRDRDGFFADLAGTRLSFEVLAAPQTENETERSLLAAGWREGGLWAEEGLLPRGSGQEERRSTFRTMATNGGLVGMDGINRFTSASITRPELRWIGENRGGWSNPDYDRAALGVQSALDADERVRQLAAAARAITEQLGVIFLHYSPSVLAHPSALVGVSVSDPEAEMTWNIHEWAWR